MWGVESVEVDEIHGIFGGELREWVVRRGLPQLLLILLEGWFHLVGLYLHEDDVSVDSHVSGPV